MDCWFYSLTASLVLTYLQVILFWKVILIKYFLQANILSPAGRKGDILIVGVIPSVRASHPAQLLGQYFARCI
jgi:hypothetical protein